MTNIEFFGFFAAACASLGIAYFMDEPEKILTSSAFSLIMWVLTMYQWTVDQGAAGSGVFYALIGAMSFSVFFIIEASTKLFDQARSGKYKGDKWD